MTTPRIDLAARAKARRPQAALDGPGAAPAAQAAGRGPRTGKAAGARWALLNSVVDVLLRELGDAELRVWLVLYRDVRGGVARVGMTDMARRSGMTRRGVVKAVAALKARGIVEVTARGTIDGRPNTYRLKAPT